MQTVIILIGGALMALANTVPGVSGGTIALIMGFYDRFIGSIDDLIFGKKKERLEALRFLVPLAIGMVVAFIPAVLVLSSIFESHIYVLSSLFFGLTLFAFPVVILEEKETFRHYRAWHLLFLVIGLAIVAGITFCRTSGTFGTINTESFSLGLGFYSFVCGAVGVSAMVLPGMSGSTLLLIFGMYNPVIDGISSILKLDFSPLPMILCFGVGVIFGFVVIVKLLKKCLARFRSQSVHLVLGMMLGSLYAIVMGPQTLDVPQDPLSFSNITVGCVIAFVVGGLIIVGLQLLKRGLVKDEKTEE